MKKISNDIKRMLSTLAMQDAGEYLSRRRQRLSTAEPEAKPARIETDNRGADSSVTLRQTQIAVPFTGQIHDAVVDYLQNTPFFANARVDILAYGPAEDLARQADILSRRLRQAGKETCIALMQGDGAARYRQYRKDSPDLRFIVAPEDDALAHEIINNPVFHNNQRHVPMVLIHTHNSSSSETSVSVA